MTSPLFCPVRHTIAIRNLISVLPNGAAIFSGVTDSGQNLRVLAPAKVLPRIPLRGETWYVVGVAHSHPQFGEQLHASTCRYELPKGRLIIRYLADNPEFEGVGEVKAKKLWDVFGERLPEILTSGDIRSLEAVLTTSLANRLVQIWAEKCVETEVIVFLDAYGFHWSLVTKMLRVWGVCARAMLEVNPYHLLAFASWPRVDGAAIKLGLARDDNRRLVGAVESALYDRLEQSHTLTDHATLASEVDRRLSRNASKQAIDCALAEGAIVGDAGQGYQSIGAAALERGIEDRIRGMIGGQPAGQKPLFSLDAGVEWAVPLIRNVEDRQGFRLNGRQRRAVLMPFHHQFSLLTGGAGVGKTTVLRVVIALAQHQSLPVLQMALAGRAAQRMAAATGHPAMTIARFLARVVKQQRTPPHCLVVIDEASMLDLSTLYRILRNIPDGARMLLVGDPGQLPPIGFGLVFHRLVGGDAVPQTELIEVHRQSESSGIPEFANTVREHHIPSFVEFYGKHLGVSFIACSATEITAYLKKIAKAWNGEDYQILSPVNNGHGGVKEINQAFHFVECDGAATNLGFAVGEPVIHLVNDYDRGLMNGSLGRISSISDVEKVTIDFEDEKHEFSLAETRGRIELAYAISVHKAQGSEFKRVAVVVAENRILDHSLIYTALTRGIEQVVFIGDRNAFINAVSSPPLAQQRSVAFKV